MGRFKGILELGKEQNRAVKGFGKQIMKETKMGRVKGILALEKRKRLAELRGYWEQGMKEAKMGRDKWIWAG